jgi:hypothetical protein
MHVWGKKTAEFWRKVGTQKKKQLKEKARKIRCSSITLNGVITW